MASTVLIRNGNQRRRDQLWSLRLVPRIQTSPSDLFLRTVRETSSCDQSLRGNSSGLVARTSPLMCSDLNSRGQHLAKNELFYKQNSRLSRSARYTNSSKKIFKLNMRRRCSIPNAGKYEKLVLVVHFS